MSTSANSSSRHPAVGSETGAVALMVAIMLPLFIGLAAFTVDVANWYVVSAQVQKAADAAALGGVTYMPQDFASATAKALAVSSRNGYTNSTTGPTFVTTATMPARTSQLRATVTTTFDNIFGKLLGRPTMTITRTAVADYLGPALMGSPCNALGTQPTPSDGSGTAIPTTAQGGFATCQGDPQFWTLVEGPATDKVQGDRYATNVCDDSSTDFCASDRNSEYRPDGYVFVVRVNAAAVNQSINLQIYDPAYVTTGQDCGDLPSSGISNGMNPYAPDASARYDNANNGFCTGDSDPGGSGTSPELSTTFALREQTDTFNPLVATPVTGCIKQFRGFNSTPTATQLDELDSRNRPNSSYKAGLAQVFHQWVSLCSFTPTRSGDYYLQVRTNADMGGSADINTLTPTQYLGLATDTTGRGANAFAIRAVTSTKSLGASVQVSGWERMPIFANATAATSTFNLLQVSPNAAGRSFYFSFFDVGDAASSGTVRVLRPNENTTTSLPGCTYQFANGVATATGNTTCSVSISNTRNNGKVQTMTVPVPSDYTCTSTSLGGCWFRVAVTFSSGSVHDATTWDATIGGDAVRLVE
jgi:Flp pilus assembly protein TadG